MIREKIALLKKMIFGVDLGIVCFSFFASYYIRSAISFLQPIDHYIRLLPLLILVWAGVLYFSGSYNSFRIKRIPDIVFAIFGTSLAGFFIFGSITYIFKIEDMSRIVVGVTFALSFVLLSAERIIFTEFLRYIRKKGYNSKFLLIVGTGKRAQNFVRHIESHDEWGLEVIGFVDGDSIDKEIAGHPVLGGMKDLPKIIKEKIVDEVMFIVPRSWMSRIEESVKFCELQGLKVGIAVDHYNLNISKIKQSDYDGFPFITFEPVPTNPIQLFIKRFFDITISGAAIFILSPLFLITALLIKLTSKGPVFFRQDRCGLNGRHFMAAKFRTMVDGAEKKRNELLDLNEMTGPVFKIKNDPRLTGIGQFLRKFSIDELPQFFNVLRGDMSLVGPRPLPIEENDYKSWQRRRLSVKPGITCLWQVNGRNKINDFDNWVKLDLEYIDSWSLGLDFKILLRTIPAVMSGFGAK